ANFALRWKVIKFAFAKRLPTTETLTATQHRRGERGIWQRRYWEHLLRDEEDYQRHFDYIHSNPLKHGHVQRLVDWPYSSFHRAVAMGIYPEDWCGAHRWMRAATGSELGRWRKTLRGFPPYELALFQLSSGGGDGHLP